MSFGTGAWEMATLSKEVLENVTKDLQGEVLSKVWLLWEKKV